MFDATPIVVHNAFDTTNLNWQDAMEYNVYFLRVVQNTANDMLCARGHLFLNEVYDLIGLRRTPQGAIGGWLLDVSNPIDLGLTAIINGFNDNPKKVRAISELMLTFEIIPSMYEHI